MCWRCPGRRVVSTLRHGNFSRIRVATLPPTGGVGGPRRAGGESGERAEPGPVVHGAWRPAGCRGRQGAVGRDGRAAPHARAGAARYFGGRPTAGMATGRSWMAAVNHFRVPVDRWIPGSRPARLQKGDGSDAPGAGGGVRSMASRWLARSDDLGSRSGVAIHVRVGVRSPDPGSTPSGRHARSTARQGAAARPCRAGSIPAVIRRSTGIRRAGGGGRLRGAGG